MIFFLILGVLVGALSVIFILENMSTITVTFLSWQMTGSLAVVLLLTAICGVIMTLLLLLPGLIRDGFAFSSLKKKKKVLESELEKTKREADTKSMNDIYNYTVPVFVKLLGGLKNVLEKTAAHAKEKGLSEAGILSDRLAPDMYPLSRQVQIACDNAKGATARLSGEEPPKYEDTEQTISELQARIDKTLEFIQTIPAASFIDAANRKVSLPYWKGKHMLGGEYALEYAVPNFLFHVTTAYAIARKNGVPLVKGDFINGLPLKD